MGFKNVPLHRMVRVMPSTNACQCTLCTPRERVQVWCGSADGNLSSAVPCPSSAGALCAHRQSSLGLSVLPKGRGGKKGDICIWLTPTPGSLNLLLCGCLSRGEDRPALGGWHTYSADSQVLLNINLFGSSDRVPWKDRISVSATHTENPTPWGRQKREV